MAVGFALLHRERTGEGQYMDASLLDTYFHMHEANVPMVSLRGGKYRPTRSGSQHPGGGPTAIFRYRRDEYRFPGRDAPSVAADGARDGEAGAGERPALSQRPRTARQ